MNSIIEDQDTDKLQRTLMAQSNAYSKAKNVNRIESIIIIIAILSTLLIPLKVDVKNPFSVIAIFSSIAILIASYYIGKQTKEGARLQEYFDVELFKIDWQDYLVGTKPTIKDHIFQLSKKDIDVKKNNLWYSAKIIKEIPHSIAVILCFKCNTVFGLYQRQKYIKLLKFCVFTYYIISILLALLFNPGVYNFAIFLAPSIPFLNLMVNKIKSHEDIYGRYKHIDGIIDIHIENYKKDRIEINDLTLRKIQDLIYLIRVIPTKIPNWYYRFINEDANTVTDICIEETVNEFITTK